jgi:hypothetical protein
LRDFAIDYLVGCDSSGHPDAHNKTPSRIKIMKYMLLIYAEGNSTSEEEREHCYAESGRLINELHAQGKFLAAAPLHPVSTATSVRVRNGKRLVTDGPFAETHEHLGGYYLIDAQHLDEAIDIAGRIPGARWGTVEVRPVIELPGRPAGR